MKICSLNGKLLQIISRQLQSEISVLRCSFQSSITQPSIHYFADASMKAYEAIVFIAQQDQVSFVMTNKQVVPLKLLTLPQLELMATLIATRLIHFVLDSLSLQDQTIYMWSDSQIVLYWVQSEKQFPAFVLHHISEMKSQLHTASWRYCPTLENLADLLTRGTNAEVKQHGPSWLTTPDQWPMFQLPPLLPLFIAAAIATENFFHQSHLHKHLAYTVSCTLTITVPINKNSCCHRICCSFHKHLEDAVCTAETNWTIKSEELNRAWFHWI